MQTVRSELSQAQRHGRAVLQLVALYAMRILGEERDRLKVLSFDEASFLTQDAVGQQLLDTLVRWGRSELGVPILSTQQLGDIADQDNLIGHWFLFGMRSREHATRGLELLDLDTDDARLLESLTERFGRGRALYRDLYHRCEEIQFDPDPRLLELLRTTPAGRADLRARRRRRRTRMSWRRRRRRRRMRRRRPGSRGADRGRWDLSAPGVASAHAAGRSRTRRPTAPAGSAPARGGGSRPGRAGGEPRLATQPPSTSSQPSQPGAVASAPDVTEQLGGTDPLCAHPAGLSAQALANCQASGSPQSPFPAGNYTPDTHIDTGLTDPGNDIDSAIQNVIGLVFGLFVTVIHAALLAVSLAFGFDLFASDHGQQIPHALSSMEHMFTLPWLPVAFAIGAIVGIARWWGAPPGSTRRSATGR